MDKRAKGFQKPELRCSECGDELPAERAAYDSRRRSYCPRCRPVSVMKDNWKPFFGSSVSGVFAVKTESWLQQSRTKAAEATSKDFEVSKKDKT